MLRRTLNAVSWVLCALALVAATPTDAEACKCVPPDLAQSYGQATDVVRARVVTSIEIGTKRYYRARVLASYKGCYHRGQWIRVRTASSSAACGASLETGTTYLLTGATSSKTKSGGYLDIHSCAFNVPWTSLGKAQLAWLKGRTVCCGSACWCADGSKPVKCFADPCTVASCPAGECVANYCGGCKAEFYDEGGLALCTPCAGDDDCAWSQHCSMGGQCLGACADDAECAEDHWCRPTMGGSADCAPFAQEGESCGGFTPVWAVSKCAPGLVCTDFPPYVADVPGKCRIPCKADGDCAPSQYCASGGVCRDDGECWGDGHKDCALASNAWAHDDCEGAATCDDGACTWQCSAPTCADLGDVGFGACEMLLGVAVVDGACSYVSGCGAKGYAFFSTIDECQKACGCVHGGAWYVAGASFPAGDGCNTCSCMAGGMVACTLMACGPMCEHAGELYAPGETFPAGDGCNTCVCMDDGTVACTLMACVEMCEYGGELYVPGDTFPASDGCNTCVCMDGGKIACTEMACGCTYDGSFYPYGSSFPAGDGCNTCSCLGSGMVVCTKMLCPAGCEIDGVFHEIGTSFPAGDGCNTCTCTSDLTVACTEMACPPGCYAEQACTVSWEMCWAPGEPLPCGMCYAPMPGEGCASDADCAADQICDETGGSLCLCYPMPMCVPACTTDAACGEGQVCTKSGHCAATPCAMSLDCPTNFACVAGACARTSCKSSAECAGFCVKGLCYGEPGYCSPVPP